MIPRQRALDQSCGDPSHRDVIDRYHREGIQATREEFETMLRTHRTPLEQRGLIIEAEAEEA